MRSEAGSMWCSATRWWLVYGERNGEFVGFVQEQKSACVTVLLGWLGWYGAVVIGRL